MADQVTMTWTDATGTYTNSFTIENPTLADVKVAYSQGGPPPPPGMNAREAEPIDDAAFYAGLSERLVTDVMNYSYSFKRQQAASAVPPVEITPGAPPPARSAPKK